MCNIYISRYRYALYMCLLLLVDVFSVQSVCSFVHSATASCPTFSSWGVPKTGLPQARCLFHGKSEKKMDDFLIPLFWETSICLSTHQAALRSWDSDFVVLRTWSLEMWYTTPKRQF